MNAAGGYVLPCPFALSRRFFELDVTGQPHPYFLLMAVCAYRGHTPLRPRVDVGACWHERIDDEWEVWVNPHDAPARICRERGGCVGAPAKSAVVAYRGFVWAVVGVGQGFYLDPPAPPEVLGGAESMMTEDGEPLDAVEAFALACFRVLLPPVPVGHPFGPLGSARP